MSGIFFLQNKSMPGHGTDKTSQIGEAHWNAPPAIVSDVSALQTLVVRKRNCGNYCQTRGQHSVNSNGLDNEAHGPRPTLEPGSQKWLELSPPSPTGAGLDSSETDVLIIKASAGRRFVSPKRLSHCSAAVNGISNGKLRSVYKAGGSNACESGPPEASSGHTLGSTAIADRLFTEASSSHHIPPKRRSHCFTVLDSISNGKPRLLSSFASTQGGPSRQQPIVSSPTPPWSADELIIEASASHRVVSSKRSANVNTCNGKPISVNNEAGCPRPNQENGSRQKPQVFSSQIGAALESSRRHTTEALTSEHFVPGRLSHCSAAVSGSLLGKPRDQCLNDSSFPEGDSDPRPEVLTPQSLQSTDSDLVHEEGPQKHKRPIDENSLAVQQQQQIDSDSSSGETQPRCCVPFNGHREDINHYRVCQIVLSGIILRGKHTSWLNSIPGHACIPPVVNFIIGSSCKQILLSGKCTENDCAYDHTVHLNFEFPPEFLKTIFNVFIKWFLENATQPDFRAVLLTLSRVPQDHDNTLMIVLSFVTIVLKLPKKVFRQASCLKLVEIMVNVVGLKPWEAVRTFLVFAVSKDTEQSVILDLLSSLEVSKKPSDKQRFANKLYQAVSCLWHVNKNFSCPSDLLFKVLEECLAEMPEDLKLTKDRIVADLVKLPKLVLRQRFILIDKFLSKYYPMNSTIVLLFRTSVLYGQDASKPGDRGSYKSTRVKSTGQVNPKWDYWDIKEARIEGFQLMMKHNHKPKERTFNPDIRPVCLSLAGELSEETVCCRGVLGTRSFLSYREPGIFHRSEEPDDLDSLVQALQSQTEEVVKIIASYDQNHKAPYLPICMQTLQWAFLKCSNDILGTVFDIFIKLPGSLADKNSVKSAFACMLNSLLIQLYQRDEYLTAIKLIKTMRHAGINHLEHVPPDIDPSVFAIMCSEINFHVRLDQEAIKTLLFHDCLVFCKPPLDRFTGQFPAFDRVAVIMLQRFIRERRADYAMNLFRLIFSTQKRLRYPIDIEKFYEKLIFLSFLNLKKNACSRGDGANLYIMVDRVWGNEVVFHQITYRSLLVELYRVNSPIDVIRRVLWICLRRKIYPDFSQGPISPLVLDSRLSQEEMSIYVKNYFAFITQNHKFAGPFVVKFFESHIQDRKLFYFSNDIMKTPRTVPEALKRFESALNDIDDQLNCNITSDSVIIPEPGVERLIEALTNMNI